MRGQSVARGNFARDTHHVTKHNMLMREKGEEGEEKKKREEEKRNEK